MCMAFVLGSMFSGLEFHLEKVPSSGGEVTNEGEIVLRKGDEYNWWLCSTPRIGAKETFQAPLPLGAWKVK